ncbi:hypothetical protein SAMN04515618_11515 [Collimonas sp. OK307]|nr:hypothetical protein SAMN04515618_11515 [Collimonas sp. OK307]
MPGAAQQPHTFFASPKKVRKERRPQSHCLPFGQVPKCVTYQSGGKTNSLRSNMSSHNFRLTRATFGSVPMRKARQKPLQRQLQKPLQLQLQHQKKAAVVFADLIANTTAAFCLSYLILRFCRQCSICLCFITHNHHAQFGGINVLAERFVDLFYRQGADLVFDLFAPGEGAVEV